jgi:hypothetical protein
MARIGMIRRGWAEQLHQVLSSSGAPLLGVIANDSKSGGPSPLPKRRQVISRRRLSRRRLLI